MIRSFSVRSGDSRRPVARPLTAGLLSMGLALAWLVPGAPAARAGTTGPDNGQIFTYGSTAKGQNVVPAGVLVGASAVSASGEMAMALSWNHIVFAWGDNSHGQTSLPTLHTVKAIAAGGTYGVALETQGKVVVWGDNTYGQRNVPTAAQSGVVAIAAGDNAVMAVKSDGTWVGWGDNSHGQLNAYYYTGTGTFKIKHPYTNLKAVSLARHGLGLTTTGTVVAWGDNSSGQATVPAGLSGVTAVAAGSNFSVALKSDGSLATWGDNSAGQLNVPCVTLRGSNKCVLVPKGFTAISAGDRYALAIKGGYLVGWGAHGASSWTWEYGGFTRVAAGADFGLAIWGTPSAPSGVDKPGASAGNGSAQVSWLPWVQTFFGAPIDHYTVKSSPGGLTCTAPGADAAGMPRSCVVNGLTNGTAYTFTVTATNGLGTSPASPASDPVTPSAAKAFSLVLPKSTPKAGMGTLPPLAVIATQVPAPATAQAAATPAPSLAASADASTEAMAGASAAGATGAIAMAATPAASGGMGATPAPGQGGAQQNGSGGDSGLPLLPILGGAVAVVVAFGAGFLGIRTISSKRAG